MRNETYVLALGGQVIHTEHFSERKPDSIKLCALRGVENEAHFLSLLPPSSSREIFYNRHNFCNKCPSSELTLALLLTCRQIHTEASHVPLSDNIFAFRGLDGLSRFLRRIGETRAKQLRDLLFYSANNRRPWSYGADYYTSLQLDGLRIVRLFLELCPSDIRKGVDGIAKILNFTSVHQKGDVFVGLQGLRASGL